MTLAAMLDLGLSEEYLRDQLSTLNLNAYSLNIRRSERQGLAGVRLDVHVEEDQPHRSYSEIRRIIEMSGLDDRPKARALEIFEVIARAEARVHGVDVEHVHFHEVGAVDSIVDIVGAAVGVHALGISTVICSPLPMTRGFVSTAHGTIPTPAPATLEILKDVPVTGSESSIELVTPTGAAIARALAASFGPYPRFTPRKIGYGLGKSDSPEFPNALRIVLGEETDGQVNLDAVAVLECQVDDLDPRVLGHLMDILLARGALDVSFTAVQMKKNRPGTLITALASPHLRTDVARTLLGQTTTLGVRVSQCQRMVLSRTSETVTTSFGDVRVKVVHMPDGRKERRPEFDDVRGIAERTGESVREILRRLDRELNAAE